MKRSVLIIVNSFPPPVNGGTMRVYKLVKYLIRNNINVYVLCNAHEIEKDILSFPKLHEEIGKAVFISVPALGRSKVMSVPGQASQKTKLSFVQRCKNGLNKILELLSVPDAQRLRWNKKAYSATAEIIRRNGIQNVITSSPPHSTQMIGLKLKQEFGAQINWIADFRDMWSLSHDFEHGHRKFRLLNAWYEKQILASADQVVVVSDSIRQLTLDNFALKNPFKVKVITNGYDPEDFREPVEVNKTDKTSFYFLGTIFGSMVNNKLAEALNSLTSQEPKLEFNFVGAFCDTFRDRIVDSSSVLFHPPVAHPVAIKMMREASFLILTLTNDDEGKRAFSGKFFEYLAAGRPILALVPEGEVASLVRRYSLGEVANPSDTQEIMAAIRKMAAEANEWQSYKAPEYLLGKFSRKHTASLFEELLK